MGYGNPLRGDDGVGQEVAQVLWRQKGRQPLLSGAAITWAHQLTPEMALDLSRAGFAVFVDAACDLGPAGSVTVRLVAPPVPDASHAHGIRASCWEDLGPEGLLALALELYGSVPPAALVTVGVSVTEFGDGLSPLVQAAVPRAAAAVRLAIAAGMGAHPARRPRAESGRGRGHNA